MRTTKRTEITVETARFLVIRRPGGSLRVTCKECGKQTPMVTADEAAVVAGVSSRVIHRWIEAEQLHFTETPEGLLLVCLNTLSSILSPESVTRAQCKREKLREGLIRKNET